MMIRSKLKWPGDKIPDMYPGILQDECSANKFVMVLFTYQTLILLVAAASTGHLVSNFDATGGLLVKPVKDILHGMWSFPPQEVFTDADDFEFAKQIYAALKVAEYIGNNHSGIQLKKFFLFMDDCSRLATGGKRNQLTDKVEGGQGCKPRVMRTDCDGASQNGAIGAWCENGQVTTRIMYHNVLLPVLLHYDHLVSQNPDKAKEFAATLIKLLERLIPLFLHFCKSHVYRAITDWFNGAKRSGMLKQIKLKITPMVRHFAKDITEVVSVSKAMAKL